MGYNSNVIALGDGFPLPTDISHKGSSFERVQLNPTYTFRPDAQSALTLGYAFDGDFYNGMSSVNFADHALSATYARRLNDGMSLRLRGGAQFTMLGGSSYRDGYTASAALGWRLSDVSALEVAAGAGTYDYRYAAIVPAQNRDGRQYTLSPTYFHKLGDSARLRLGYAYSNYRADGQDFSNHANAFSAGVTAALGNQITGDIGVSYSLDRYDNPNSAATNLLSRSDDIAGIGIQLVRPIDKNWRVFGQAGYVRANSNISFYNYRQATTLIGVAATF